MINKFINRKPELAFLNERFKSGSAELIIVYGRRRVGKTELLLQFAKDKPHVYFLASETSEKDNLQEIFSKLDGFFKDGASALEKTWENLFSYLAKKGRFVLIIDEFPYLITQNKAVPSLFQKGWDTHLKDSESFLVLAGSSIGMMEEHTLFYKAPLYGRRTGQWKVEPMKFWDLFEFFPGYDAKDVIRTYGALDSIPAYLTRFDPQCDFWKNLGQNNLKKGTFLYDETDFLLKQELREPKTYKSILKAIAFNNTKFSEIMNFTGLDKSTLFIYLDTLESLNIVEKRLPVLDKPKSKRGRYFIKDNFFKFWFRYVLPNKSSLEEGNIDLVLNGIKNDYDSYIGRSVFESVCSDFLRVKAGRLLPFPPGALGGQWGVFTDSGKTTPYEIDIVALNDQTKQILFCECKWQDKVDAGRILRELREKAEYVEWNNDKRHEHYAIFAKSFKERIKEPDVMLFDLNDLERTLK